MRKALLFFRRHVWVCLSGLILVLGLSYIWIWSLNDLIYDLKKDAIKYLLSGLAGALVLWIGDQFKAFTEIGNRDFEITTDKSTVTITPEIKPEIGLVFKVEVERIFSMKATKEGLYSFARECKGKWLPESYIQKHNLKLALVFNDRQIKAQESIDVQAGTELNVMLKSIEKIPVAMGHYSLGISSPITESTVQWHSLSSSTAEMKAYLYGDSFPDVKLGKSVPYKINEATAGFNLLILWNKECS